MNIHILGIAGTMTAPLASELTRLGHTVSGSDQEKIYPPVSDILDQANITINQKVDFSKIDLFIIGSSFKSFENTRQEYQQIIKDNNPHISATKYIASQLNSPNPILIAGSYGKTTISSLLTWIFIQANLDPAYLFAGQSLNKIPSLKINSSNFSIIEADESINGLDTQAKFLYYPIKHAIITSANWEHKDSYSTNELNQQAYKSLIQKIPPEGILVYNPNCPDLKKLIKYSPAKNIPYNFNLKFNHRLIGEYNHENVVAAVTFAKEIGISDEIIQKALNSFKGISRRLEIIAQNNDYIFIEDFAQSPQRVEVALKAIKQSYPDHQIIAYFEPHASFLQKKESLIGFKNAFKNAHKVLLGKINFSQKSTNRIIFKDYQQEIGEKIQYTPLPQQVSDYIDTHQFKKQVFVHFSSGGLNGINTFKYLSQKLIN